MYMYTQDIPVLYHVYQYMHGTNYEMEKSFFPCLHILRTWKSKIGIYNSKRGNHKKIAVTGN